MKTQGRLLGQVIRKSLIGILTITFCVSVGTSVGFADPIKGDCNGDGVVKSVDALQALQYAVRLIPHNAVNDAHFLACADVNPLDANLQPVPNGIVNSADALTILQLSVHALTFAVNVPSAIVKISTSLTSGSLPPGTKIGAIQATVTYPTAKALTIFDTDVTGAIGDGTAGACGPTNQSCYMLVANTTTIFGQVVLGLINAQGIPNLGEIATLNFHTAKGTASPLASDFKIAQGLDAPAPVVYDTAGQPIPNVTVVISAAAIQ